VNHVGGKYTVVLDDATEHQFVLAESARTSVTKSAEDLFFDGPVPADLERGGRDLATSATLARIQGKTKKSTKVITGNGAGPRTEQACTVIAGMFPSRTSPFVQVGPLMPQRVFEGAEVLAELRKVAGDAEAPVGFFGFSCNFLRGVLSSGKADKAGLSTGPFVKALVDLALVFANVDHTDQLMFQLKIGALSNLNKHDVAKQAAILADGGGLEFRLVNSGSMLGKLVCGVVAHCSDFTSACHEHEPIQQGNGQEAGVDKHIAVCRVAIASNFAVVTDDIKNAFPSVRRSAMLTETGRQMPALLSVVSSVYRTPSAAIFTFDRPDGSRCIRVFASKEGANIGCHMASGLYTVAVGPMYSQLQVEFPEFTFRALTDDLRPVVPPPDDLTDVDAWEAIYARIRLYRQRLRSLAGELGLVLHPTKGAVLLPPCAPVPRLLSDGALGLKLAEGIVTGGCAFGSTEFVDGEVLSKAKMAFGRILTCLQVKAKQPKLAQMLLSGTCAKKLDFVFRVLPAERHGALIDAFDVRVTEARHAIWSPAGYFVPRSSKLRLFLADLLAQLPYASGGLQQPTLAGRVAALHLSHLSNAVADDFILLHPARLEIMRADFRRTVQALSSLFGFPDILLESGIGPRLLQFLHPALHGSLSLPGFFTKPSRSGVTAVVCALATDMKRAHLAATVVSDVAGEGKATLSDAVNVLSNIAKSQHGRVFSSPLSQKANHMDPLTFVIFSRFHFSLAPLLVARGAQVDEHGAELAVCTACHAKGLVVYNDPHFDHVVGCVCGKSARHRAHSKLGKAIKNFIIAPLGLDAELEPSTVALFNGQIESVQLRAMLPKQPTAASRKRGEKLVLLFENIVKAQNVEQREFFMEAFKAELAVLPADPAMLRLDGIAMRDDGELIVWDQSTVHISAKSMVQRSAEWLSEQLKAQLLHPELLGEAARKQNTPSVSDRARQKAEKYQPLVHVYQLLGILGATAKIPTFKPLIVSHNGEFGSAVFEFIEWFSSTVARQAKQEFAFTGESPRDAVRKFRSASLDTLATASAIGVALHGMAATLPSLFPSRSSGRWVYQSRSLVAPACAVTWLPLPKHSVASLLPRAYVGRTCEYSVTSASPALVPADFDATRVSPRMQSVAHVLAPFATSALSSALGEGSVQKKLRVRQVGAATVVSAEVGAPEEASPLPRRLKKLPSYASPPLFSSKVLSAEGEKRGASKQPPPASAFSASQNRRASQNNKGGSGREGTGVGISAPSCSGVSVRVGALCGKVGGVVRTGVFVEGVRSRAVRGGRKVAGGEKDVG
jgi:hypothetical protein